jgi:hypothetical protein
MTDSVPARFSLLIVDRLSEGSVRDRTLPGGADRFVGRHHPFADNPDTLRQICRALGIGDDAQVLSQHELDLVQVPVAPLRRAQIDPVMQYVNEKPVLDGVNGTKPLQRLADGCAAARSTSARAFLARL